jgi:enamine deaminase RidA (YjgF/YER057c/UK114 family)
MSQKDKSLPQPVLPEGWPRPPGYAHAMVGEGRMLFIAGQVGMTPQGEFVSDDLIEQFGQTLRNTRDLLAEVGGGPEHLVRMTWYVRDKKEYLQRIAEVGRTYRDILGANFPAMAVLQVADFVEDRAKVEIESTAVLPSECT